MSKRNSSHYQGRTPPRKKIRLSVDISKNSMTSLINDEDINELVDVPDLTGINRDEIESTIYEAIQRNNISNAKAKYLIRKMLKHPHVIEWFRNIFNSEKPQFNLLYEPRITRSSKNKVEENDDQNVTCLDANLIGRLLLSAPTINSFEFDNDDNNDNDYSPESDNSMDSDQSSLMSDIGNNKVEQIMLSPYHTRSKATLNDLQVDLLDDAQLPLDDEEIFEYQPLVHESLSLEEMHNLMDLDVDDQRYEEFKKSLFTDDLKNDEAEDDPEFDVLAQIDDLDEDIFDDFRDDRSVKIPRSELWALLKDNNLVKGNGSSSTNKKTITMLCEDNDVVYNEPCSNINNMLVESKFTSEQLKRLSRQMIMCYQQLATFFVMTYDQQHLKPIIDTQVAFYFLMTNNIPQSPAFSIFDPPNRPVVEKILFNYKGISYVPTSRFNKSTVFRKIEFPKCIMATLLCSSGFPFVQLLPMSFKLYNHLPLEYFRQIPFLPSEDKLLTMGIIQFGHQCHKMLKLIKKYLFPIRSTDQLRNRKTNILRRQKELDPKENELLSELFRFSGYVHDNKKVPLKVHSDLAKLPVYVTPIWERKDEWKSLPDIYKSFLIKTVPNVMYNLHLCTKEEWSRANRIAANRKAYPTKEFQFCNWSSLPWELEKVDLVKNDNRKNCVKTALKKVVNKKSFPQYEVPKNSQLRDFLKKWNCNCDNKDLSNTPSNKKPQNQNLMFLKKAVKRAKIFYLKCNSKKEQKKLQTQQSYAHYFRNDEMKNLFPNTVFKSRIEELITSKDLKNPRLQRFQNKCRDKEAGIVDFTHLSFSNKDEVDLVFCRNFLNNLRKNLSAEEYEKCLNKINEFQLMEDDSNFNESVMKLMQYLMNTVKSDPSNVNTYEDLLSLLTFQQAVKLGCEIDWWTVRNINQIYTMINTMDMTHKRRFWVRLSTLIHKSGEGIYSQGKVIQHLHTSMKSNGYLQSLIAPLLNCWETPFPNFPQSFANYDSLSSNASLGDFCKDSEKDVWEYCTNLAEQPKNACSCSCHDNINNNLNNKETLSLRHCLGCNLKVYNGSIYIDESKIHRRLVTINLPSTSKPILIKKDHFTEDNIKTSAQKVDSTSSISVLEFLRTKNPQVKPIHNRIITIRETQNTETFIRNDDNQKPLYWVLLPNSVPNMQIVEDSEAAMDADIFRQIKGQSSTQEAEGQMNLQIPQFESTVKIENHSNNSNNNCANWSDEDNLLLLKLCQKHGTEHKTFVRLQADHFFNRTVEQVEDQFNYLFQQVLEYQQHS